jgi:hypothetical protein
MGKASENRRSSVDVDEHAFWLVYRVSRACMMRFELRDKELRARMNGPIVSLFGYYDREF